MNNKEEALILVDIQRDFLPGGSLPVPNGDKIISPVNKLIKKCIKKGVPIIATRDWHPENHCSFDINGGSWPVHCVQNTIGAKFAESLDLPNSMIVISKGDSPLKEAYSAFEGTGLFETLKDLGVKIIYVAGLATDYCVKETVLDGLKFGLRAFVIEDCIKGVSEDTTQEAISRMEQAGAIFIKSQDIFKE